MSFNIEKFHLITICPATTFSASDGERNDAARTLVTLMLLQG